MTKKDSRYYEDIIGKIEDLRKKNNGNWMDLLRLAFKYSPNEAAEIMSKIYRFFEKHLETLCKSTKNGGIRFFQFGPDLGPLSHPPSELRK